MRMASRLTDVGTLGKLARFAVVGVVAVLLTSQVTGVRMVSKADAGTQVPCTTNCVLSNTICTTACDAAFVSATAAYNACEAAVTACRDEYTVDCYLHNATNLAALIACLQAPPDCPDTCGSNGAAEHTSCVAVCGLNESICFTICNFLLNLPPGFFIS